MQQLEVKMHHSNLNMHKNLIVLLMRFLTLHCSVWQKM